MYVKNNINDFARLFEENIGLTNGVIAEDVFIKYIITIKLANIYGQY